MSDDDGEEKEEDKDESMRNGSVWSVKYHLLKRYKQQQGDCMVPHKHGQLGYWVNNTRAKHKENKIPQEPLWPIGTTPFLVSTLQR